MAEPAKLTEADSSPRYIRWDDKEWELITRAAGRLGEQVHASIRATEFVRGAALKRAEDILDGTEAPA